MTTNTHDTQLIDERNGLPSASHTEALLLCPARWRMEQAAGLEAQVSEIADRGTRIHTAIETGKGDDLSADDFAEARLIVSHETEAITSWCLEIGADDVQYTIREERMWMNIEGKTAFSGKPDVVHIVGKQGLVVDYKTGFKRVTDASENPQIAALCVLAAEHHGLESVRGVIIHSKYGVTSADFDSAALMHWKHTLRMMLRNLADESIAPIAGEKQCQYCRAFANCPSARKNVAEAFRGELVPMVSARELEVFPLVEKYISERRRLAKIHLKNGGEIDGFALGNPRRICKITDVERAWEIVDGKIPVEAFVGCCDVSVPKAADALAKGLNISKKAARVQLEELWQDVISITESEPSLVRREVVK
jgi:hypothetical protein